MTKEEKIKIYYDNPKYCEQCGKIISYDGELSIAKQYEKRFCNKECSNIFIAHNRVINNNSYLVNKNKSKVNRLIGIYCIENKINGKRYIGQSEDIKDRLSHHKSNIKYGHSLVKKIREEMIVSGYTISDFNFYILKECNIEELDDKEKYYISLYNTYIDEYGYNEDLGGRHKQLRSTNHNKKISEIKKKQFSDKDSEFYRNFKEGQNKTKKPILQINDDGEIIKRWEFGALEASEYLSIPVSNIYNSLYNLNKTCDCYWIKEEDLDNIDLNKLITKRSKKKVYQYSFDGCLINVWNSAYEAKLNTKIDDKSIALACNGKCLQSKGYIWSYHKLSEDEIIKKVNKIPKYVITRNTPDKKVV